MRRIIECRQPSAADEAAAASIMAVATDELRSVYRPVKSRKRDEAADAVGIVATIDDEIVGTAEYLVDTDSLLVRGLAVSPSYRKQGVAAAMISYLMLEAKKEGKTELLLSTVKETGNVSIFSRLGFTVFSEEISDIFESVQGGLVTLAHMRKRAG